MKSKKIASLSMIIGGLILLANYSLNTFTEKKMTSQFIIIACAAIFILLGVFSFKNQITKSKKQS